MTPSCTARGPCPELSKLSGAQRVAVTASAPRPLPGGRKFFDPSGLLPSQDLLGPQPLPAQSDSAVPAPWGGPSRGSALTQLIGNLFYFGGFRGLSPHPPEKAIRLCLPEWVAVICRLILSLSPDPVTVPLVACFAQPGMQICIISESGTQGGGGGLWPDLVGMVGGFPDLEVPPQGLLFLALLGRAGLS